MDIDVLSASIIVLGLLALLQVLALVLLVRSRRLMPDRQKELLDQTKTRSQSILHRAMQQANRMVVGAELKGIELLARYKLLEETRAKDFSTYLQTIEDSLKKVMAAEAQLAEHSYEQLIAS